MSASKLDAMYRSILLTKFFTKGWGKPENLRRLFEFRKVVSNRDECFKLVERDYPVTITKEQTLADCRLLEGYFITPLERYLPGIVPEIAQKAHFQAMLPLNWQEPKCKPVCLHLAGTGDHFFWRRRNLMVKPLLKEAGIGGIILENPFYGLRKPTDQIRSSLHNVSDIFVMGGCLILESLVLFHWCERNGLGPLGVTGLSMGGHMASLAATNWPKPLVLVPCLSWSTASAVFLQGVMAHSINWDLLEDQYLSDGIYREKLSKMVTIVDKAFLAGKKFAQTYSQNIEKSKTLSNSEKSDGANLDITYKEFTSAKLKEKDEKNTNVMNNIVEINKKVPKNDKLNEELYMLLKEDKISRSLYDKLTSNEKFELDSYDIDDINNLNQEIIKEVLLITKIAEYKNALHNTDVNSQSNMTLKDVKEQHSVYANKGIDVHPKVMTKSKLSAEIDSNNNFTENVVKSDITKQHVTKVEGDFGKFDVSAYILNKKSIDLASSIEHESNINSELSTTEFVDEGSNTTTNITSKSHNLDTKSDIMTTENEDKKLEKKSWSVSDITHDLWMNLPFVKSSGKKIDIAKIHWRDREALQFMRGIMDECTHLSNFSIPYDTSLIIAVCAKHDAYVPRDDVGALEEIWPGSEVRYVDAGHISAYILHQSLFRSCIIEAFERSKNKWENGKHID